MQRYPAQAAGRWREGEHHVSRKPMLYGYCGHWYEIVTEACGMVRVIREAKNRRLLVQEMKGADLTAALEKAGYPDLNC